MLDKIHDFFFPKYYVVFGYMKYASWYAGEQGPYDSWSAARIAAGQGEFMYGEGTHWVTDKNGKRV